MRTITHYHRVSDTKVISFRKNAGLLQQKYMFQRYAKSYRLAFGKYPEAHSITIELSNYEGLSFDQAIVWLNELKDNETLVY